MISLKQNMTTLLPPLASRAEDSASFEIEVAPEPTEEENGRPRSKWIVADNDLFKFGLPLFVGALSALGLVGVLVNAGWPCVPDDAASSFQTQQTVAVFVALLVCVANAALFVLSLRQRTVKRRSDLSPLRVGVLIGSIFIGSVCFAITLNEMVRLCLVARCSAVLAHFASLIGLIGWTGLETAVDCYKCIIAPRFTRRARIYGRDPNLALLEG